jgi:hypothetical protein
MWLDDGRQASCNGRRCGLSENAEGGFLMIRCALLAVVYRSLFLTAVKFRDELHDKRKWL